MVKIKQVIFARILVLNSLSQQKEKIQSTQQEEREAMDSKHWSVMLNDGHFIPALGYGTYKP